MVVLSATRATAKIVNEHAQKHFGQELLQTIPAWPPEDGCPPCNLQLFRHARIRLTATISFENGLVNGAEGEVLEVQDSGIVICLDSTGEITTVWPTSRKLRSVSGVPYTRMGFEVALAYATTVHQMEGQSLPYVCVIFERFSPPGWAYTAITRAKSRDTLWIIGQPACWQFVPRTSV